MIKKIIVILLLHFPLSGCFPLNGLILNELRTIKIEPNHLPDAVVGKPYFVDVEILGAMPESCYVEVIPKDALNWKSNTYIETTYSFVRDEENNDWVRDENGNNKFVAQEVESLSNVVTIYGTPTKKGVVTVKFYGSTYPTMFRSKKGIKTRKITIKE